MTNTEILTKLHARRVRAKESRDGSHVVISYGDEGYLRVHADLRIEDCTTLGRGGARSRIGAVRDILTA